MEELISVIVPVYNVELYLKECIDSIVKQTYKNIEIILVDDGSSDNSGKICDEYAQKYEKIKVVHQSNKGLTVVRKVGVHTSSGKYIGFVDGDDWIDPDMYKVLYTYAKQENADMVTSSGYREYQWGQANKKLEDTVLDGVYHISYKDSYLVDHIFPATFDKKEHLNGAVWNKLFRREVIGKVLDSMDEHIHGFMDDNVCVVGSVIHSNIVCVTHECFYHHREHPKSFSSMKHPDGLKQINYAYLSLKKIIEDAGYKNKLYKALCEHTSLEILQAYNMMFEDESFKLPVYLFRSNRIPISAKVVIYGYGNVGKDFIHQIQKDNIYKIVGIADKNARNIKSEYKIYTSQELLGIKYDFIIIAVEKVDLARQIQQELILNGINQNVIIWEKPLSIFEYFK